jgi:hypothetical protein
VRDHLKCVPAALLLLIGLALLSSSVHTREGEATTFVCPNDNGPNTDSLIHYNFAGFNRHTGG